MDSKGEGILLTSKGGYKLWEDEPLYIGFISLSRISFIIVYTFFYCFHFVHIGILDCD